MPADEYKITFASSDGVDEWIVQVWRRTRQYPSEYGPWRCIRSQKEYRLEAHMDSLTRMRQILEDFR